MAWLRFDREEMRQSDDGLKDCRTSCGLGRTAATQTRQETQPRSICGFAEVLHCDHD